LENVAGQPSRLPTGRLAPVFSPERRPFIAGRRPAPLFFRHALTFEIYAKKFRSLVAGVSDVDGGKAKHDYVTGGYQAWLDKEPNQESASATPAENSHTSPPEIRLA